MIKLAKYLKPYLPHLLILVVFVFFQVMANLQLPDYMSQIVNKGIVEEDQQYILNTGGLMLVVSLVGGLCTVGAGFFASKIATSLGKDLRSGVFHKVESFSMTEFNKFSTASLITRSTNDIQQIQTVLVMALRMVLMAPIMGVGAIMKAYVKAPSMSWIIALAVVSLIVVMFGLFAIAIPKFKLLQNLVDKLNLVARENLTGLRVIRAFNAENYEEKKFDKVNRELTALNLFVSRLMVLLQPVIMMIFNLTALGVIWFGAHMIGDGDLAIGDMMAFMQYAMQVIMAFLFISIMFIMIPRASVSADRVVEVLDTQPTVKDPETPKQFKESEKGTVEFKNVEFTYPGADTPVLQDISFRAESGKITAFIGSTGSGKSTLIDLIPRFYDVTAGQVLVDGVDVCEVKQYDLHEKIGYVPQKRSLFSGTVLSNLKYGTPKATESTVKKAIEIAQAKEFIDKMPEKMNSTISQGGKNVSGGQMQRLSIARALVKQPEIYIFDDSFSALDFKTDRALREALLKETKDSTVLIVGQRISTIMHADQIIVLDKGKIVGVGKHEELMKTCTVYREIALSQLSEKELSEEFSDIDSKTGTEKPKEEQNV